MKTAFEWTSAWAYDQHVKIQAQAETASTNSDAKAFAGTLGHGSVVVAFHQTAGRGRGAHTWTDEPGQALLSSWIFNSRQTPQPIFAALVGLALYQAVKKTWPAIPTAMKAPNDLHVVGGGSAKKLAGLLIEVVSSGADQSTAIIGLGLNVHGAPAGTQPFAATFLEQELAGLGEKLKKEDWFRFLTTWRQGCEMAITDGVASQMNLGARGALVAALAAHPNYAGLEDVGTDGSLIFKDGRVMPWSEL